MKNSCFDIFAAVKKKNGVIFLYVLLFLPQSWLTAAA